jgi:cellulose synthase/poly-beta-1,6-N-acetylglucosamine synthase-like glycosyltransferase
VSRLAPASREFIERLVATGNAGAIPRTNLERRVARLLVDRGFAHPLPTSRIPPRCAVVIPVLNRIPSLVRLMRTLRASVIVVVDDGSDSPEALARAARQLGASVERHESNQGPAAARNTGLRATDTEFVAFIDSDCEAPVNWPSALLFHFDDPAVAAVAPRIVPAAASDRALDRY